jgi:hypothetical protein
MTNSSVELGELASLKQAHHISHHKRRVTSWDLMRKSPPTHIYTHTHIGTNPFNTQVTYTHVFTQCTHAHTSVKKTDKELVSLWRP